jgi:hypothetical protein
MRQVGVVLETVADIDTMKSCRQRFDANALVIGNMRHIFGGDIEQHHALVQHPVMVQIMEQGTRYARGHRRS